MHQIRNIVNYDKETLNRVLDEEMMRFCADKRIARLSSRIDWGIRLPRVASLVALACTSSGLVLSVVGLPEAFCLALSLVGLSVSSLNLLVRPMVFNAVLGYKQKLQEILDTYDTSPATEYHSFVVQYEAEGMEIWGYETRDSMFEATLSKMVNGELKQKVILFKFVEQSPVGPLTLDVQNGTVLRMAPDQALPVVSA